MNHVIVMKACEQYKHIVDMYYENEATKLYNMIDQIIFKLRFDVDNEDFYSLANEIFLDALCRYDGKQDFNGFLYSCLRNKFKTEMTRRNRIKRKADKMALSLEEKVTNCEENIRILDILTDKKTVENEYFEHNQDGYSKKMTVYLGRLSTLQREVLRLISIGFSTNEILEELHINRKMYEDCYSAIHSYKNKQILM